MSEYGVIYNDLRVEDIGLKIGSVLKERYEIKEYISFGSMTITYLADDKQENKHVFIKEMAPAAMVNRDIDGHTIVPKSTKTIGALKQLEKNFDNEIKIIKELSNKKYGINKQIPEYIDAFKANNTRYFVTSFCEGKNLQKRISDGENISFSKVARKLIRLVQLIHKAGVIHRDIKLSNILLTDHGKLVLLDFGSAYFVDRENETLRCVSKCVAAPEMYDDNSNTRWVDSFSIGAVMYQMLTGFTPICFDKRNKIYIEDISKYVNIPWILAVVIMKLLEVRPEKRLKKLWLVKMLL
ncbi:MAG: protein kinase [Lachnospiraceae bacterium]|nr:protein kinase [Lachnospiraceae bacterium]